MRFQRGRLPAVGLDDEERRVGEAKLQKLRAEIVAQLADNLQNLIRSSARFAALTRETWRDVDALVALGRRTHRGISAARRTSQAGGAAALTRKVEWNLRRLSAAQRKPLPPLPRRDEARIEFLCEVAADFVGRQPVFTREDFVQWVRNREKADPRGAAALARRLFPSTRGGKRRPGDNKLLARIAGKLAEIDAWFRRTALRPRSDLVWLMVVAARYHLWLSAQDAADKVGDVLGCDARTVFELMKLEAGFPPHEERLEDVLLRKPGREYLAHFSPCCILAPLPPTDDAPKPRLM